MFWPKAVIFIGMFALATSFLAVPSTARAQQDVSILEGEKQSLQEELQKLEAEIDSYKDQIEERGNEISSLKNQIAIINARINKLNTEIKKTQNQIAITKLNIQETQIAIDEAVANIETKKATLAELLRNMYNLDNESLVERMLKYDTLSQVLSETEYLDTVQKRLNETLDSTREAKRRLESHEVSLSKNKSDLEEKNRQLGIQQSAEKNERAYRNTILQETREEEKRYQELLSEAETERAEFMERIARIEEQILIQENFVSYFKAGEIPPPGTRIFLWPQEDPILTQHYGFTAYARRGAYGGQGHNGLDMTLGLAAPVRAAAGGTIAAKGEQTCQDYVNRSCNGFWGNWVAIQHPGGLVTLYSHLTKPSHKNTGDEVKPAEIIGYEGATGNVTGPHLHFSVYTEFFTYKDPKTGVLRFSYNIGKTLNPLDYL